MGNARSFVGYRFVMMCLLSVIICTFCGCANEQISYIKSYQISISSEEHAAKIAKAVVSAVEEQVTIQNISQDEDLQDEEILSEDIPLEIDEVYDLVERGDLSVVTASERNISYLKDLHEGHHYEILWKRADITGDEVPELLCQEVFDRKRQPIKFIFTYYQGKAELIFVDLNDYTEYYFLGDSGNLVYDYTDYGIVNYGSYERVLFSDEKDADIEDYHIIIGQERIIAQFFDDWYDEEDIAYYKERYPDTYGTYGPGIYCYRETPTTQTDIRKQEWVREQITKEEFLDAYKDMTGFDFLEENRDWEYDWDKTFE